MSYLRRSRYSRSPSPYKHYGRSSSVSRSLSRSLSRSQSRSRESIEVENPGNNLYVTGLSPRITKRELEKHFSSDGTSIHAWAQLEVQQENNRAARQLFEEAVQASPKNRFAWHVWGVFESNLGNVDKGKKLLKIGHALTPRDPVLLQSLGLLEYRYSTANLACVLFRRASEIDPRHQPVWIAWGWMEWKEGNIATSRELYQRALSINSTSESAARCLQES